MINQNSLKKLDKYKLKNCLKQLYTKGFATRDKVDHSKAGSSSVSKQNSKTIIQLRAVSRGL